MLNVRDIMAKLVIADQWKLNNYINQCVTVEIMKKQQELEEAAKEKEALLTKMNDETWHRIETYLHRSMREHHVSEKRIKSIDLRTDEIAKSEDSGNMLLGEERKTSLKVMNDKDFQKIFEIMLHISCNGCNKRNYNCETYPLLKKYNIPYSNCGKKCKYGY